ncbi:FAD/NAD(P)-binding domain-containing protein [Canariomyces notabilis]|uniref:FAD/NAD(P)-binding domain-containing protein n=1 Tax=Canariomyces notabilis TaxID=2074819 RepID=A0AAN6YQR0_9PEZI|nr:FAD/NAD(P)-binding domain-containing protein [Canariomyces arenarius]
MDSTKASETLRVLVIGGGSAGLLMGHVFKRAGIEAAVFEQDQSPTARQRDWNFGIYWAQSRIEECLASELYAQINQTQTDRAYRHFEGSVLPVYNGQTGELLKDLPAPHAIRLRRRSWLDLIRTGVDIRYGKRLVSIATTEQGVTATFEDGTTEEGSLLIGCEGAHSVARNFLFQMTPNEAELLELPISAFVTITNFSRDLALALRKVHPTYVITVDPTGLFFFCSAHNCDSEDSAEWTFMFVITWKTKDGENRTALSQDNNLLLDTMLSHSQHLAYPFKDALHAIPRNTKCWHTRMSYWPTKPWDNRGGRVTLAGDAAHPMTFHRGQGLGNAITDVAELQIHLRAMKAHTREELAKAIGKYEQEVWTRGLAAVMENAENTVAVHDWEKVTQSPLVVKGLKKVADKPNGDEA